MAVLLTIHIIITLSMIGVILLQKSDGGSALMGGGSSSSMFSARGVANLLTRATAVLAALFLGNCLLMATLSNKSIKNAASVLEGPRSTPITAAPAKPVEIKTANKNDASAPTDKKEVASNVTTGVPANTANTIAAIAPAPAPAQSALKETAKDVQKNNAAPAALPKTTSKA